MLELNEDIETGLRCEALEETGLNAAVGTRSGKYQQRQLGASTPNIAVSFLSDHNDTIIELAHKVHDVLDHNTVDWSVFIIHNNIDHA